MSLLVVCEWPVLNIYLGDIDKQFRRVSFCQLLSSRLDQYHVSALELVTTSVVLTSWLSHTMLQPLVHRRYNIRVGTSARLHRRLWWRPIHTPLNTFWPMHACIQIFSFKYEGTSSNMNCSCDQPANTRPIF